MNSDNKQQRATLASPPRTVGCAGTLAHPVGNLPTADGDGTSSAEALPVPNSTSTSADDGAEGK